MSEGVKIGLETHVQLDTDTKLFCGCSADLGDDPNTHTCETCLGMPGAKPRTNGRVIDFALKACRALNCGINRQVRFSRKTYFYPDMSKNFQITQYEIPVGEDGLIKTRLRGEEKEVAIKRVHIEEDPARIVHRGGDIASSDYTLVDYNRAGIPLIEVVTEPVFESPAEARAFLQKLTRILEYLDVYDPSSDLSIKSDANISIEGGERVEVKNITGTKGIEKALNYEITRQRNLQKRGRDIERETRSYSSAQEITTSLRQKETESGYGYIFEPDLTQLGVTEDTIESLERTIPELPDQKFERFREEYPALSEKQIEALITDPRLADDFEVIVDDHDPELTASVMTKELKKVLNYNELSYSEAGLQRSWVGYVIELLEEDRITDRNAELLLRELVDEPRDPTEIVDEQDLLKAEDDAVEAAVESVLDANPEAVEDYRSGKEEALNFLVGQVMQESGGKADPRQARELIEERL
jgi:aspartyl-tRNA(Asn)/glutamyl-tRNA(Gln) amidotransferase subunit B